MNWFYVLIQRHEQCSPKWINLIFNFSFPLVCNIAVCACNWSTELQSTPKGANLSKQKTLAWNASFVVLPLFLWLSYVAIFHVCIMPAHWLHWSAFKEQLGKRFRDVQETMLFHCEGKKHCMNRHYSYCILFIAENPIMVRNLHFCHVLCVEKQSQQTRSAAVRSDLGF